jgi:hypothetical protein
LRPWKPIPRSHWDRGNRFRGLIETAGSELCKWLSRFSRRKRSHMQNGFRPWVRALGGIVWWKKTEGRKSRDTVPLSSGWNFRTFLKSWHIWDEAGASSISSFWVAKIATLGPSRSFVKLFFWIRKKMPLWDGARASSISFSGSAKKAALGRSRSFVNLFFWIR